MMIDNNNNNVLPGLVKALVYALVILAIPMILAYTVYEMLDLITRSIVWALI